MEKQLSEMPDARNPRIHPRNQIRQIAHSIEPFGFDVLVLVDAQGWLIAGHGRVLAAQSLGMTHVPKSGSNTLPKPKPALS